MTGDVSAKPRIIGRILSLGFPLPGARVDNFNFLTAPSFFDYDALVVDPAALAALIESVARDELEVNTFSGAPVRATPATGEVGLGAVLMRRRDEVAALLANGGVVVCFAQPETTHDIADGPDLHDYFWLPEPGAVSYGDLLTPADGTLVDVVDFHHPLAAFVDGRRANIAYRAHVRDSRIEGMRVFARSRGGAAVGVEIPLERGRLILLPALKALPGGDARYAAADALQAGIRRALGAIAEGREPTWVASHPLPGLDERAHTRDAAHRDLERAQTAATGAEHQYDELARFRRLLWQEGEYGLEDVVIAALELIGCEVYAANREKLEARVDGQSVLIEIEASEHPVDLTTHHRLRQRIERALEQRGPLRGVLFVNGERLLAPEKRSHVTDAVRLAAETMCYCIAPTPALFEAVAAKLAGDDEATAAFRRGLTTTNGVIA